MCVSTPALLKSTREYSEPANLSAPPYTVFPESSSRCARVMPNLGDEQIGSSAKFKTGRQAKRIKCTVQNWATSKRMKFGVKLGDKQRGLSAQLNNFECSRQKVHGDQKLL